MRSGLIRTDGIFHQEKTQITIRIALMVALFILGIIVGVNY